jgi:hypothetical protein
MNFFDTKTQGDNCRDINECDHHRCHEAHDGFADVDATCIQSVEKPFADGPMAGQCGYYCKCTAGFRPSKDGQTCEPYDDCEANPDQCGQGQCIDEDPPSEKAHCKCKDCFVSSVNFEEIGAGPCQKINYCTYPDGTQRHMCDLVGDTKSTCVDQACDYSCECTEGYEDVDGVCEDINDCVNNKCNRAIANSGSCVDRAAPATGYDCYCHCGYVFNDETSQCESCEMVGPAKSDQDLFFGAGVVSVTNDDRHLIIVLNVGNDREQSVYSTGVNINHGALGSTFTTQRDMKSYRVDGQNLDGSCMPDVTKYGVMSRETAQTHSGDHSDCDVISGECVYNEKEQTYNIPLGDILPQRIDGKLPSCKLSMSVTFEYVDTDTQERTRVFALLGEGDVAMTKCKDGSYFKVFEYTLCGLPTCSDEETTDTKSEPTTEEPTTEEPTTEVPTTEEPTTEEPTTEEPTTNPCDAGESLQWNEAQQEETCQDDNYCFDPPNSDNALEIDHCNCVDLGAPSITYMCICDANYVEVPNDPNDPNKGVHCEFVDVCDKQPCKEADDAAAECFAAENELGYRCECSDGHTFVDAAGTCIPNETGTTPESEDYEDY